MSRVSVEAERCLVAVCAHLSMMTVRSDSFDMWRSILVDLLPDCEAHPEPMQGLVAAADQLAFAQRPRDIDNAKTRLRLETESYFSLAAGNRLDAWKQAKGGGR